MEEIILQTAYLIVRLNERVRLLENNEAVYKQKIAELTKEETKENASRKKTV